MAKRGLKKLKRKLERAYLAGETDIVVSAPVNFEKATHWLRKKYEGK